jgi:hypothetical protein
MQFGKRIRNTSAFAVMFTAAFAANHAAAQPSEQKGPQGGAPRDFLDAVNETQSSVKLEFFTANTPPGPDARAHMMACMSPKQTLRWPLAPETPVGRIRMQVMGGNGCDEPKQKILCERSIDRAPGLQYVSLRGEGNNCGVFPMPAPARGMLQAASDCGPRGVWAPLTIKNKTNYGVWVTMYHNTAPRAFGGPEILYAACWMPHETRMACVDKKNYIIRAQFTGNERWGNAKSCSERVYRDTEIRYGFLLDMNRWSEGYMISAICPGHECRWE